MKKTIIIFLLSILILIALAAAHYDSRKNDDTNVALETINVENEVYLAQLGANYINVRDHGAAGDGVSDDYEAVLRAAEQAGTEGKALFFPRGSYYLSRKLVINRNLTLVGENKDSVTILFRDIVQEGPIEPYNQRGMITLTSDGLSASGITFMYMADNATNYTRSQGGSQGSEGVLFSILRGSDISFQNCDFVVSGAKNPSVTCMWVKSEAFNISNLRINSCVFRNNTCASVGGCLWISSHDNPSTLVSNIEINNCVFSKRGNDEALSLWGYHIENAFINNNNFNFDGNDIQNDALVAFGMSVQGRDESLKNVHFNSNVFNLSGKFGKIICVQVLTGDSDVEISNNRIDGYADRSVNVNCFAVYETGNSVISNNTINVEGANIITYVVYTGGNSVFSGNAFTTRNCNKTMLVRSPSNNFFPGALRFERETYDIGDANTNPADPDIQYPACGQLVMDSCTVSSAASALNETCIQSIYSSDANYAYQPNSIVLNNCNFDTALIFRMPRDSNTSLISNACRYKGVDFLLESAGRLGKLEIISNAFEFFRLNNQDINPEAMAGLCQEIRLE